jgi:hypothetical protein
MVSNHLEQARDEKRRFASPLSQLVRHRTSPPSSQLVQPRTTRTAPPPSRREDVCCTTCTTPPPSCQEASSDSSIVEMWVLAPPPSHQGVSSDSSSDYNDECPHVKKGELIFTASRYSVQLFSMITKCIHSYSDSRVRKGIGLSRERTSAGKEGQPSTESIYRC